MELLDFKLDKWRMEYAGSVAKYADNIKVADNLRTGFPHPYTLRNAQDFINLCMGADTARDYYRAIVVDGEAVGSIGVFLKEGERRKSGELGYWLGEPFWGKQLARRAIRQICGEVFGIYDIERIYAEPYAHNIGSRKALEYSGFTLEGVMKKGVYKKGRFIDSCIYAILRDDYMILESGAH